MSEMGDMVGRSISLAIESYTENKNTMNKVFELSSSIRLKYFEVEDLTFDMLLQYQPVADDFRLIRSSTEISYAFSRLGRYAYDITLVRDDFGNISKCISPFLIESSTRVRQMIKDAVMSFAELDIRKAVEIRAHESFVDNIYRARIPQLINSSNTRCALAETLLLRYLERIGDHAVFMSDAVNYIVTGKHRPTKEEIASHTCVYD